MTPPDDAVLEAAAQIRRAALNLPRSYIRYSREGISESPELGSRIINEAQQQLIAINNATLDINELVADIYNALCAVNEKEQSDFKKAQEITQSLLALGYIKLAAGVIPKGGE